MKLSSALDLKRHFPPFHLSKKFLNDLFQWKLGRNHLQDRKYSLQNVFATELSSDTVPMNRCHAQGTKKPLVSGTQTSVE